MLDQAPAPEEDLYSNNMGDTAPAEGEDKPKPDAKEDTRGDEQEAILPRSILSGKDFKVGDRVELEVTAIRDNEISVKYSTGKGDSDEARESEGDDKVEMPAAAKDSLYD